MREIKFRAWDKGDNRMIDHLAAFVVQDDNSVDVYAMDGANYPQGSNIECSFHSFQPGQLVVMQFTGLKDKNGVEIYEGDIVKTPSYPKPYQISEVVFIEGSFAIYLDGTKLTSSKDPFGRGWIEISQYSYSSDDDFEIIGNVYENPELLKTNRTKS